MWSPSKKKGFLILLDAIVLIVVSFLSFGLRFDFVIPQTYWQPVFVLEYLALVLITRISVFYIFKLYNRILQYASMNELKTILLSTVVSSTAMGTYVYLNTNFALPRSILFIHGGLTILFIGGVRFFWRFFREGGGRAIKNGWGKRTFLIGAGDAGEMILRELKKHPELDYNVVGIIDDDPAKLGMTIHGYKVIGNNNDLPNFIDYYNVEEVIVAIASAPGSLIRKIHTICQEEGVKVKVLPGVYKIISGEVTVDSLREVQVEDLLRREIVSVDLAKISEYLKEKTVMVTGGGGSIGSELTRQIAEVSPQNIIVLDASENNLYKTHRWIKKKVPGAKIVPVIANIRDKVRIEQIINMYKPQVIYHAAAYKHVPLMECHGEEAFRNNVLGTFNVVEAAHKANVERFILVSSDKAVNPISIMGASKRICELIIKARDNSSKNKFIAVRFGNVLESDGSVIPLFKEQIQDGGPVTITHKDVTRYFMTMPEAVQLVIQAGAIAEEGDIFILDMGEPVKILELARDLISLTGLKPEEDIDLEFTGLRPGDKLYEELVKDDEELIQTDHDKIFIGKSASNTKEYILREVRDLELALLQNIAGWGQLKIEFYDKLYGLWEEEMTDKAFPEKDFFQTGE